MQIANRPALTDLPDYAFSGDLDEALLISAGALRAGMVG